jgi:hypothetical protein
MQIVPLIGKRHDGEKPTIVLLRSWNARQK